MRFVPIPFENTIVLSNSLASGRSSNTGIVDKPSSKNRSLDSPMIVSKLVLPLSPPSSPPMTTFDQYPPTWSYVLDTNQSTIPQHSPGAGYTFDEAQGSYQQSIAKRSHDQSFTAHATTSQVKPEVDTSGHPGENEDVELSDVEAEEQLPKTGLTKTELTAYDRRVQRFRLTHSQTRYLMSEFAKQPRPDAAQRARLSREISGFSPRQVQVWFQNRRAKLKRLTNDDRERIMSSRALPADFDMTHTLRSPFNPAKADPSNAIPPSNKFANANIPEPNPPAVDTSQNFSTNHHASSSDVPNFWRLHAVTQPESACRSTVHDPYRKPDPSANYQAQSAPEGLLSDVSRSARFFHNQTSSQIRDLHSHQLHPAESRAEPCWSPPRPRIPYAELRTNDWLQAQCQGYEDTLSTAQFAQLRYPQRQRNEIKLSTHFEDAIPCGPATVPYNVETHAQYIYPETNNFSTRHGFQSHGERMHPVSITSGEVRGDSQDLARIYEERLLTRQGRDRHDSLIQFVPPVQTRADSFDWR